MKSLEHHIAKCVSILERGDNYIAVQNYLNYQKVPAEDQKKIFTALREIESNNLIEVKEPKEVKSRREEDQILGAVLMLGGVFLIYYLWGKGFVAWLPMVLVFVGFMAIKGQIQVFEKYL